MTDKPLKVLFLHLENAPISWYRMIQYANEMKNVKGITAVYPEFTPEKHDLEMRPYELDVDKYIPFLNRMFTNNDIIVIQNVHSLKLLCALEILSETHQVPVVLEIDDNPFEIDENHYAFKNIGSGSEIENLVYDQIKSASAIVTSTGYLGKCLELYNKNIYTVNNAINFDIWDKLEIPKSDMGTTVIGWAGANGHQKDLSLIKDAFTEILEKDENIYIKCLHGAKDIINHPRFLNNDTWTSIDKYPQVFANMGFDIGVAPLWDNEFNRCKSNLRYLELSALKIPTVASNVEPYAKSIQDGKNGFIAKNKKEFVDKILKLVYNKDLRKNMGYSAYQDVKKNYNIKTVTQKYADILRKIYTDYKGIEYVNIPTTTE